MSKAIIGDLSIETADGTVLSAPSDIRLARLWAEHENGAAWPSLGTRQQNSDIADALAELRRSAG